MIAWDRSRIGEISKKRIDAEYILKVEPKRIVEELDVEFEREESNMTLKCLTLANEKIVSITEKENYRSSSSRFIRTIKSYVDVQNINF